MRTVSPYPNVAQLFFPNRKELTITFCRAQEFYEAASDDIRGKHFTWETFLSTFADESGKLDYFSFWSGFNIPGEAFGRFLSHFGGELTSRETALRDAVFSTVDRSLPHYVIGAMEGAESTMRHEMAHALFHVSDSYRSGAIALVESLPLAIRTKMSEGLAKMGYSDGVHRDEMQAYLSTGEGGELQERFGLEDGETAAHRNDFSLLLAKHLDG